jgi:hypothetical protein
LDKVQSVRLLDHVPGNMKHPEQGEARFRSAPYCAEMVAIKNLGVYRRDFLALAFNISICASCVSVRLHTPGFPSHPER